MVNTSVGNVHDILPQLSCLLQMLARRCTANHFSLATNASLLEPRLELVLVEEHHAGSRPAVPRNVLPLVQTRPGHPEELGGFGQSEWSHVLILFLGSDPRIERIGPQIVGGDRRSVRCHACESSHLRPQRSPKRHTCRLGPLGCVLKPHTGAVTDDLNIREH